MQLYPPTKLKRKEIVIETPKNRANTRRKNKCSNYKENNV